MAVYFLLAGTCNVALEHTVGGQNVSSKFFSNEHRCNLYFHDGRFALLCYPVKDLHFLLASIQHDGRYLATIPDEIANLQMWSDDDSDDDDDISLTAL